MGGRSKSEKNKKQNTREVKDGLMARAVAAYNIELGWPASEKKRGLRKVCKEIEAEHYRQTRQAVKLDPTTLQRLANGGKSQSQSNREKGWLKSEETDIIIAFAVEIAARGFPLSHERLRRHVNAILHARLGTSFPITGVGRHWMN
jgi:hypothetical protein